MSTSTLLDDIDYKTIPYGSDPLQQIAIYTSKHVQTTPKKWIVYIHGGAWRDPTNTHHDGDYIISSILNARPEEFSGASMDYPLSSSVQHPGFVDNTLKALALLNERYQVDEYIIVGHSAGAHIGLQTFIFGRHQPDTLVLTQKCHKLFGIEGIYILDLLTVENEGYRGFTEEAFGENKDGAWDAASPFSLSLDQQRYQWTTSLDKFKADSTLVPFSNGTLYICHSPDDELLLEKHQPQVVHDILKRQTEESQLGVEYVKISGGHEEAIRTPDVVNAILSNI